MQIETDEPLAFVTVPLATFLSFGLPETMKTGLLNGNILRAPTDEYDWLVPSFERWARDLQRGDGLGFRAAVLEVEGLLARIAAGTWAETQSDPHRTSLDLQRAASMASYISTHFTCDLRVSDVAEQVHLHPNRAATVFRRVFGTSIPVYLQNFRIAEAQRLLLTTDLDSAQVATRAGFQSSSSYHHAFAAMSGASPHRWRRQHLGGS